MEELVLTGQRIMQFHNPGLDPEEYFMEALHRDPLNSLANLHMGNLAAKAGRYREAADYYRNVIDRITRNYTRPRDCEAFYRLGVVLKKQKKYDAAIDTLYRASWDQAWHAASHYELAEISMLKGQFDQALDHLNQSLSQNAISSRTLTLKSSVLRQLGDRANAAILARRVRDLDPLNHMAAYELLQNKAILSSEFTSLMNNNKENYLELASSFINAGLYEEASTVVGMALESTDSLQHSNAILYYYAAWLAGQEEDEKLAEAYYTMASEASTDYVFPFRFETLEILDAAIEHDSSDARAWYYKGNILYDHQPSKAIVYWNRAVRIEPGLAIAHRNLGWGYYRYLDNIPGAIGHYETALDRKNDDPRYYFELDVLYELNNEALEKRYELFENNHDVVRKREDSYLREIEVLILNSQYDSALSIMTDHVFIRQEGMVNLHDLWVDANLLKGWEELQAAAPDKALEYFLQANTYPSNQRIGRISEYQKEAQIFYLTASAYEAMGEQSQARNFFKKAAGSSVGNSEYLYYRSMAQREQGKKEEAMATARHLIRIGEEALEKLEDTDFFAKFGERAGVDARRAKAYYLMALGQQASGDMEKAGELFTQALEFRNSILWASVFAEK